MLNMFFSIGSGNNLYIYMGETKDNLTYKQVVAKAEGKVIEILLQWEIFCDSFLKTKYVFMYNPTFFQQEIL